MRPPRLLALAAAALTLLAAPVPAGARDSAWPIYSNSEFGFAVRFPGAPKLERFSQPVNGSPVQHLFASYDLGGDSGMMVMVARFDDGLADPTAALEGAANGVAAAAKGQVISRTNLQVGGQPAILVVVRPKDDFVASDLIVVKGATAFQLLSIGHGAPPKEADAFQSSFTLIDARGE